MKSFVKMGAVMFSLTLLYFRVSGDGRSVRGQLVLSGTSNCLSGNTYLGRLALILFPGLVLTC